MYIARGRGKQPPGDKVLISTVMSCHFIHLLQVSKICLWSLILYIFFHDLIHVYSPGAGADSPLGTKFWFQQLSCYSFVASFKEISLKSDFIQFFSWFNTCIYPRGRCIQPPGEKVLMSTETSYHFGHLLLVSNHRRQQFLNNPLFYLFPIQKHKGPNLTLP